MRPYRRPKTFGEDARRSPPRSNLPAETHFQSAWAPPPAGTVRSQKSPPALFADLLGVKVGEKRNCFDYCIRCVLQESAHLTVRDSLQCTHSALTNTCFVDRSSSPHIERPCLPSLLWSKDSLGSEGQPLCLARRCVLRGTCTPGASVFSAELRRRASLAATLDCALNALFKKPLRPARRLSLLRLAFAQEALCKTQQQQDRSV